MLLRLVALGVVVLLRCGSCKVIEVGPKCSRIFRLKVIYVFTCQWAIFWDSHAWENSTAQRSTFFWRCGILIPMIMETKGLMLVENNLGLQLKGIVGRLGMLIMSFAYGAHCVIQLDPS